MYSVMAKRYFHGFDPGEAETKLRKVAKAPERSLPAIHQLNDAVALPGLPGLYDRHGYRIDAAAVRTVSSDAPAIRTKNLHKGIAGHVALPSGLEQVDNPVLFGGHLMKHYGHFIIESMSRMWARDYFPALPILFTSPRKWSQAPAYGVDVLAALKIFDRALLVDKPTIFRTVVCPSPAVEYRWKAFAVADEPHIAVANALDGPARRKWERPVYLTRSGLASDLRKSEAEPELEAELSVRGFDVIAPEFLSLQDQIHLFENVPLIAGTLGSALHTAMFSRSRGLLALLNWGRGFEHYLLVDEVKQHTAHYIKCIQRRNGDAEYVLDVAQALRLMEQAGLLNYRPSIAFST
jgi:capsular polysaccharide biosynthesis protein